jgi:predicted MFS family arabinose efflux permease
MIIILLLMVAAVTVADDPILVLGPALTSRMHVPMSWSGWFIAALGAGSVIGSLRPSKHRPSPRLAATALALLGGCMILFVTTPWMLVSIAAALGAGMSGLVANVATRTLLSRAAGPERVAAVMAVWAIAWAGSKPFASLADGLLADSLGVRWAGLILAVPALVPLAVIIFAPHVARKLVQYRRGQGDQHIGAPANQPVGVPIGAAISVAEWPDLEGVVPWPKSARWQTGPSNPWPSPRQGCGQSRSRCSQV